MEMTKLVRYKISPGYSFILNITNDTNVRSFSENKSLVGKIVATNIND